MKVLIGVDGSAGGFTAVRQAGRLMDPTKDRAAFYYTPPELRARGADDDLCARARTALADAIFDEARTHLPAALQASASTILGEKNPRQGVLLAAEESKADLIAIGARGAGTMPRLLLGSVANTVVRNAHVPVLVARDPEADTPQAPLRVLLAWDGSPSSCAAATFAAGLHWPPDTRAVTLTVVESMLAGAVPAWLEERARSADADAMAQAWIKEHEADKQQKQAELTRFCQSLPGLFRSAAGIVSEGHAAEQILHTIAAERIDVVVLGAHGLGAIERLLIGSTSEKVMAHAPCSVLVVRQHPHP
ncbi:MAG: universal stress protein [Planctomycetia bacterium]|nr:universal stress protein [Planctomycetia bacterium]